MAEKKIKKNQTYQEAMRELEEIVAKLQDPHCEVDQLCDLTERSVELLQFCKSKLTQTDEQLSKLLKLIDNNSDNQ